ncbi:MAG: IS110 family transposase [Coriobacteriaceae bacterium]|nr:MAG: IS110 family transposase [Coriobacteriaceae bacterium]
MALVVSALRCIKGISTVSAFSIAAEIKDFSHFSDACSPMSFVGLVPSKSLSGKSVSRGKITQTGNVYVRTLPVEAA